MKGASFCWVTVIVLSGCAANFPPTEAARSTLQFVDVQQFDRELGASLAAPLPHVEVSLYDRIAPSALPSRLQRWLGASDQGGGKFRVVPAPGTVVPKNPLLLVSMISSLWSGNKMAKEIAAESRLRVARNYDVRMFLRQDEHGDTFVDRIIFDQRTR